MAIHLDGTMLSTTMRTPGHDFELAAGFCHAEGVLGSASITGIRYCGTGSAVATDFNVVSVDTSGRAATPSPRLGSISSSCGICGSQAIGDLAERLEVLPNYPEWDLELLQSLPSRAEPEQMLFAATGTSHAAAAFSREGEMLVLREDIGRHNAVDKVVGHLLLGKSLPATDLALFISGRASFEMVQKAWAAGFSALVSASGGSALSVATARHARLTMLGFVRGTSSTLYSPTG